jgi:hypothetical protein
MLAQRNGPGNAATRGEKGHAARRETGRGEAAADKYTYEVMNNTVLIQERADWGL